MKASNCIKQGDSLSNEFNCLQSRCHPFATYQTTHNVSLCPVLHCDPRYPTYDVQMTCEPPGNLLSVIAKWEHILNFYKFDKPHAIRLCTSSKLSPQPSCNEAEVDITVDENIIFCVEGTSMLFYCRKGSSVVRV
jgi:hypothetical protein